MTICKHCGLPESMHHPFEAKKAMPPGCVCPPGEWETPAPVCDEYRPTKGEVCDVCWHDRACHDNARALREVKDG